VSHPSLLQRTYLTNVRIYFPSRYTKKLGPLSAQKEYGTRIVRRLRRRTLRCTSTYLQTRKKYCRVPLTKSMNSSQSTWVLLWKIREGAKRCVFFLRDRGELCALTSSQRKWPEEKIFIGLESIRNFNVRAKVVGPTVSPRYFNQGFLSRAIRRACSSSISSKKRGLACRSKVKDLGLWTRRRGRSQKSPCTFT